MQASVDKLFAASQKVALSKSTFVLYVIPPLACFYVMGVLVQLKGTQYYRLALLPILMWLAWRSAFVDMSGGDPTKAQNNSVIMTYMLGLAIRGTNWATVKEPYRRQNNSIKSDPEGVYAALWNGWDLVFNNRGVGWNWSKGLVVPKPLIETDSRIVFVLWSAVQLAFHALCLDVIVQTIHVLAPGTIGGGSLFDGTLPPVLELLRAFFVALSSFGMVFFGLHWSYHFIAIIGVVVFQQTPSQWPPLYDSPWLSSSLTELWGRRWHQLLRESVVTYGERPFNGVFGRVGGLLGAFFMSGVIHDLELRSLGKGGNSFVVFRFWLMNGVGVVLERAWLKATGKRVSGVYGRVWTLGWLTLWGLSMADEWAKAGRYGLQVVPGEPSVMLLAFVRRCLGQ